mmetsp:Transcript_58217/g.165252  ORF Transcript_58217/g.165252 Transcript_58217/m.165252 type:complete len:186 (+) Transcript_58217:103-660(+)
MLTAVAAPSAQAKFDALPARAALGWQQRIRAEDKATARAMRTQHCPWQTPGAGGLDDLCNEGVAPLHDMHRGFSLPGLLPRIGTGRCPSACTARTSASLPGEGADRDLLATASRRESMRSRRSAASTASLHEEVARSVQDEMTRVVQTGKDDSGQLMVFASKRDKLEHILGRALGERVPLASRKR